MLLYAAYINMYYTLRPRQTLSEGEREICIIYHNTHKINIPKEDIRYLLYNNQPIQPNQHLKQIYRPGQVPPQGLAGHGCKRCDGRQSRPASLTFLDGPFDNVGV